MGCWWEPSGDNARALVWAPGSKQQVTAATPSAKQQQKELTPHLWQQASHRATTGYFHLGFKRFGLARVRFITVKYFFSPWSTFSPRQRAPLSISGIRRPNILIYIQQLMKTICLVLFPHHPASLAIRLLRTFVILTAWITCPEAPLILRYSLHVWSAVSGK